MFRYNESTVLVPVYKQAAVTAAVQYMNDAVRSVKYDVG
jgi:hypothetical protein